MLILLILIILFFIIIYKIYNNNNNNTVELFETNIKINNELLNNSRFETINNQIKLNKLNIRLSKLINNMKHTFKIINDNKTNNYDKIAFY